MRTASAAGLLLLLCCVGCTQSAPESSPSPTPVTRLVVPSPHLGSLGPRDVAVATAAARRWQRKVTGTFVGATAFAARGAPFDRGSACDLDRRMLDVRLVWEADGGFVHGGPPGAAMPDGPRRALLLLVDPETGHVCEVGARYRDVGAGDDETLLYGEWPDPRVS